MKKINQLKAGAILSYISMGLTSFISLLYTPIMLRLLGQSEYGLYNLSHSIIGYLGVLDFGLGNAVVRYTAKYRELEDKESEQKLYGMFIFIYSLLGIITLFLGAFIIFNVDNFFGKTLSLVELDKMKILVTIMMLNLAISFPFSIFSGIISAYEHFIFPKVIAIIRAIINPLVMIPLLFLGYKAVGMAIATTIVNIVFIGVNLYYCFVKLRIKIKFTKFDFSVLKEISGYSYYIFLNIIVDKIYWSTDQFILGSVSGTVAVAVYSVASTINNYYMNFSKAISGVFLPKVTRMVTRKVSDKELSDLFIRTGRIQYIVMSFILCGFFIVGKEFVKVWAGIEYLEAYYIVLIIMIPLTIPLIQNLGITILQAKNMQKFRSNVYILIALINIFLTVALSKIYGGIGAAISTAFSMIIGNIIIINIYYYKKIKINIPQFWKEIGIMTIPVSISLVISIFINSFINISGYLGIFIKGSIFSILFIILMWIIGMNNYEKNLIEKPLNKIKEKFIKR